MSNGELLEIIAGYIVNGQNAQMDSILESELGLCSFDMMGIIHEIESRTQTRLNYELFRSNMSVNDLMEIIKKSEVTLGG